MIRLSTVDSVTDRRPLMFGEIKWAAFVDLMREQSEIAAEPTKLGKEGTLCVSPAIYSHAAYRGKAAVAGWDWFSADIDNKRGNRLGATIEDMADVMAAFDAPFVIYTTASHKPEAQCFRLMFPLDRMILAGEFDSVWRSFASGFGCFDEQTKDISRLFIAPRSWAGRANRFLSRSDGKPICVDSIVTAFPAPVEAKADPILLTMAREMDQRLCHRHGGDLTDFNTSPIISRRAVESAISGTPGGRMFRFLCSVACSARQQGYALDEYDLRIIGADMAHQLGRRANGDLAHDVRNAIRYADRTVVEVRASQLGLLHAALTGKRSRRP